MPILNLLSRKHSRLVKKSQELCTLYIYCLPFELNIAILGTAARFTHFRSSFLVIPVYLIVVIIRSTGISRIKLLRFISVDIIFNPIPLTFFYDKDFKTYPYYYLQHFTDHMLRLELQTFRLISLVQS